MHVIYHKKTVHIYKGYDTLPEFYTMCLCLEKIVVKIQ